MPKNDNPISTLAVASWRARPRKVLLILLLIGGWGGVDPLLDFSNDGTVGIDDLLAMLDHFGCSTP
jgi:hypothetical protein